MRRSPSLLRRRLAEWAMNPPNSPPRRRSVEWAMSLRRFRRKCRNADIIWMMTPVTKVEFLARSEIDETTLVDSLGAIDRFYELSVQHAFWHYLVLGAYVSYEIADYVDNPLVDQRWKEGLTAEYYFNPYASVYARYEHTDFTSTDPESDFTENEVRLGMRIRH
jgi:hypothetical protein